MVRCCQSLLWHRLNNSSSAEIFLSKRFMREAPPNHSEDQTPLCVTYWRVPFRFLWDTTDRGFWHSISSVSWLDRPECHAAGCSLRLIDMLLLCNMFDIFIYIRFEYLMALKLSIFLQRLNSWSISLTHLCTPRLLAEGEITSPYRVSSEKNPVITKWNGQS